MKHRLNTILLSGLLLSLPFAVYGQANDKVDVFTNVTAAESGESCKNFVLGKPVQTIAPEYPQEARAKRIGGAVRVEVLINSQGQVENILQISGEQILQPASRLAAEQTKFSQSRCDGNPVPVNGVLIFNFIPLALTDFYIVRKKASEFSDVSPNSPFYEPIVSLTENYKISFGYADGKFHQNAPLTKGDFAHFLRLTLDLLQARAELSKKIPREIELYFPSNPLKLTSSNSITDFEPAKPYADSIKTLIAKYDIALTNERKEFAGKLPLTHNEVIAFWTKIFGDDAVPVNFSNLTDRDRIMSRGEFALFLHESLFVLTYKVLP